jgi:hypothetical protein
MTSPATGRQVRFTGEDSPDAALVLEQPVAVEPGFHLLPVTITAPGLSCSRHVITDRGDGLDSFFAGLARDWRGWEGVRRWHAMDGDFTVEARHTGIRVQITFTIPAGPFAGPWAVAFSVTGDPGEQLDRIADDVAELLTVR